MVFAFFLVFCAWMVTLVLLAAFAIFPEQTRSLIGGQLERFGRRPTVTNNYYQDPGDK